MLDTLEDTLDIAKLHDTFFMQAQEIVVVTDNNFSHRDGPRILKVNPAFERAFGYTAAQAVGQPLGFLYPPDVLAELLDRMRAGGSANDTEIQAYNKDGRTLRITAKLTPIFSTKGKIARFVQIGRDVTADRRTAQKRETTERLLASIFTAIDRGLAVVGDGGRFVMANPAFTRQLKVKALDILGKPFTPYLQEGPDHPIQKLLQGGPSNAEGVQHGSVLSTGGSILPVDLLPIMVDQPGGHPYWLVSLTGEAQPAPAEVIEPGFEPAIRRVLARSDKSPQTVVAGKLQLIGLDEVRVALGDKWPAFAERIFTAAENILKRLLTPRDAVSRTKDNGFLVCFADLDEQEASFKANVLRREIRDRLIGESPELVEAKVASFVAEIPLPENTDDEDFDFAGTIESRLRHDREQREKALRQSLWTEITASRVRLERVRTGTGQPAPLMLAHLPETLEKALDALGPAGDSPLHHEARMLLLSMVAERALSDRGVSAAELILVPVHISTLLDRRNRESWLKIARGVEGVGKARLVVEIHGLSKDIGQTRITDVTTRCAPFFRAVAIELADCADTALIAELPQSVRILTLPARRAFAGQVVSAAFGRAVKASAIRMRQLLVKEVGSTAQAKSLVAAGTGLLAGPDLAN